MTTTHLKYLQLALGNIMSRLGAGEVVSRHSLKKARRFILVRHWSIQAAVFSCSLVLADYFRIYTT
eukprot:1158174-Pelagomonas_calceolata.AAC.5